MGKKALDRLKAEIELAEGPPGDSVKDDTKGDARTLEFITSQPVKTVEDALAKADVDRKIWEVDRFVINSWEVGARNSEGQVCKTPLWQVKVWLKRKTKAALTLEDLLEKLEKASPVAAKIRRPKPGRGTPKRALEICLFDPHFGLRCFTPGSDHSWSLDECERVVMWALDSLIDKALQYGPFDEVVWPFGNDYLHSDNVFHTTTAGTAQPEAESWHHTYVRGEQLAIAMADRMLEVAPVKGYSIPGNHDRQSTFTLGRVLRAYYHNNPNIEFDASPSPYKFWRYGENLVGFEHGHSVKPTLRLAALMANECREWWAETSFREWHLGDQHRKGTGKTSAMEEQGVSVEFLPGLTPPNEWHRLKGFNWQKRGALAYVWNHREGQEARVQVNIDSYTGKPTGEK